MNEQLIKQFDSLSSEHDGLIDECFYEWAKEKGVDYWSEGDFDYPDEFKINFMNNGGIEQ